MDGVSQCRGAHHANPVKRALGERPGGGNHAPAHHPRSSAVARAQPNRPGITILNPFKAKRWFRVLNAAAILTIVAASVSCEEKKAAPTTYYKRPPPTPSPAAPVRHSQAGHEPKIVAPSQDSVQLQTTRWNGAKLKPSYEISVNKAVMLYLRTKDRYEAVAKMRGDGVPAPVIFALHYRESDNSFKCHLHEGSSLLHRTRFVPKGRLLPPKEPPYTWEESAKDAIYDCDKLQGPWSDVTWSLDRVEHYNGWGYRKLGVPSPYLWSGTSIYTAGKYVSDGHYNSNAIDQQLGCAAILLRMKEKGIDIRFAH
jgi:lysozyme family protein